MYLILIDAHSKWIEAFCTSNATSQTVIGELRTLFAQFGLPETIVSDNGTCFVSSEFKAFLQSNGIRHITSAPYHPASNGRPCRESSPDCKEGLEENRTGKHTDSTSDNIDVLPIDSTVDNRHLTRATAGQELSLMAAKLLQYHKNVLYPTLIQYAMQFIRSML